MSEARNIVESLVREKQAIVAHYQKALAERDVAVARVQAERDALRVALRELEGENARLRNRVLVPLTEREVRAALHEGRAEAMAATGDNAWTSLLKQRDEARARLARVEPIVQAAEAMAAELRERRAAD